MKIAVAGTSNSLLINGYFPIYQALEYPNQVDNFSHGASYCHYIPFALEKYAILENYDFLITDCCPNDGSFFPYARTEDWFYNELHSIFSQIKEKNCKHLHLIFPTNIPFAIHEEIHRQVCTELAVPYLDIGALLKNTPQTKNQPLYADKMHISPFYAKQFAYVIKQKRQEIINTQAHADNVSCYTHKKYFMIDLTKDANCPQNETVTRATSLRSENFVQIQQGKEICLENLPECNLESLYFYTNYEAGYYSLTSENILKNYNLAYHLANIFHFRPIPANDFPVNKFLKIKAGFNFDCQEVMEEFNIAPYDKNSSELFINALLFSKKINPPLPWQKKETLPVNEKYLKNYNKINTFINSLSQLQNHKRPVPEEFILIGAMLFPEHATIRKCFITILKTTQNPWYFFYFVQCYLLPRKKYTLAGKILEYTLSLKKDILFAELLAKCYLAQNCADKAYAFIQQEIPAHSPVIRLKLLLAWAEKAKNKKAFMEYAKEMLEYGTSLNHIAILVKTAVSFQEHELAQGFFSFIINDPRNFQHERDKQKISSLLKQLKNK